MSELKSFIVLYDGKFIRAYKESEADKVIAEKAKEIARLDDLAHAHNIELLRKENLIAELEAMNHDLEEERRWRKFPDEKPEEGQKVLFRAKYKTDNIRTWIGEFRNVGFDVFYASAPGWGCEFLPNEIFGWMPLPSDSKEQA